ncbi:MAG: hypothetical protein WBS24_12730 [Terriglobales bacterium]
MDKPFAITLRCPEHIIYALAFHAWRVEVATLLSSFLINSTP